MTIKEKIKGLQKYQYLYRGICILFRNIQSISFDCIYFFYRIFPLKNKVVASSMSGRKYAGNPRYVIEKIHELYPSVELVWIKDNTASYLLPNYVRSVNGFGIYGSLKKYWEYVSAKVWIDSHCLYGLNRKRKEQLFINTWHGGLGIKKIGFDANDFKENPYQIMKLKKTVELTDVFVSNSEHLSNVYRSAFHYKGKILKCGFPENDALIMGCDCRSIIREYYNLNQEDKILIYAPTFRDLFECKGKIDMSPFNLDFKKIKKVLKQRFGGEWKILIRWHPILEKHMGNNFAGTINATQYPDIQKLIMACDAFISDYSSCIFDAAICGVPCFTYTVDADEFFLARGMYYSMEELPFSNARSNKELEKAIINFDMQRYRKEWREFSEKVGLMEDGCAAEKVAKYIIENAFNN